MAFCRKCGAEIQEGAAFCPSCGTSVHDSSAAKEEKSKAEKAFEEFNNTADTTDGYDTKDIEDNKVMGILAYIGILFLIPLLAAPKSRFARFHANQGLVLFLAEAILGVASRILALIPFLGWVVGWIISGVGGILCVVLLVLGIINAANGKAKELPLIGGIKLIK